MQSKVLCLSLHVAPFPLKPTLGFQIVTYAKIVAYSFDESPETMTSEDLDDMLGNLMTHHDEDKDRFLTETEYLHPFKQRQKRKHKSEL